MQKAIDGGNTALRPPTLLLIVTLGEYSYTRDDGVKVVPLAALRD